MMTDKRLADLRALKDNWDNNGASAIIPSILDIVGQLDLDLSKWYIFPELNGNILLVFKKNRRYGISIGVHQFAYVSNNTKGHQPTNKDNLLAIISQIEQYG